MEFEKIRTMLTELLHVPAESITPSTELVNDLGMDSLDVMKFVIALENKFEIQLKAFKSEHIFNVGDVVDFVKRSIRG